MSAGAGPMPARLLYAAAHTSRSATTSTGPSTSSNQPTKSELRSRRLHIMSSPTDEPAELESPVAEDPEAHGVELPRLPRCHRDNDTFIDDVQGRNAHETIWGHKPEQYPQPEPTDEWF